VDRQWEIEMARGTVKWFNPTKGYGFIQPQGGGGRDVFVHISAVERAGLSTLNEGQQIEYEIEENRGKTSAVNMRELVEEEWPELVQAAAEGVVVRLTCYY
jgi:CspA family cold shock protein